MRNKIRKQLVGNIAIMVVLIAIILLSIIKNQKENTINTNTGKYCSVVLKTISTINVYIII